MTRSETQKCLDLGGTLRARTAAQTLAWIQPHLVQFGITRVADVTGLDCLGIPVFVSIRPNAKNLAVAQGKGVTKQLAIVSAMMESIEDFHSENPPPPALVGSFRELSRRFTLLPLERLAPGYFPQAVNPEQPLAWAATVDHIGGQVVHVPQSCVCLDTTAARPEYAAFAVSSTGLASGNTKTEAICHAVLEVIERDAHARWLTQPARHRHETVVDLETITGPCLSLLEGLAAAEVDVRVWDMTSSIGVPAFTCVIWDRNPGRTVGAFSGDGAHLSSDIALSRALTEAAQSRLTLISGSRDDMFPSTYRDQRLSPAPRFPAGTEAPRGRAFPRPAKQPTSFEQMLDELVGCLRRHGYEQLLVLDHERPEWGIPVVHAFVPGLRDLPV